MNFLLLEISQALSQNFSTESNEKFDVNTFTTFKDYTSTIWYRSMADAQFKELFTAAKSLKENKKEADAISALEKLIITGKL
jgi:predicted 2-oxoglutarate/Fe(II)-dependent dioxygenase YbiX